MLLYSGRQNFPLKLNFLSFFFFFFLSVTSDFMMVVTVVFLSRFTHIIQKLQSYIFSHQVTLLIGVNHLIVFETNRKPFSQPFLIRMPSPPSLSSHPVYLMSTLILSPSFTILLDLFSRLFFGSFFSRIKMMERRGCEPSTLGAVRSKYMTNQTARPRRHPLNFLS